MTFVVSNDQWRCLTNARSHVLCRQLLKVQSKSQYVAVLCSPTISFNFKPRPETKNIIKFGSFPGLAGDCSSRSAPDSLIPVHRNQLGRVAQIFPPPPASNSIANGDNQWITHSRVLQYCCCAGQEMIKVKKTDKSRETLSLTFTSTSQSVTGDKRHTWKNEIRQT